MITESCHNERLNNKKCLYCNSYFVPYNKTESISEFFHCPNFCIRIWYNIRSNEWQGLRIYVEDKVCLRYYNNQNTIEIYTDNGDRYDWSPQNDFNLFSKSMLELNDLVDRLLFLEDF